MKNLKTLLQQLGFIESEAKVILALMELGSAKVADISKKSGVDRVNTYGILSKLMQQGLVSQNEMAGVKTYISEPPEKFLQIVKEKQDKASKLEQEFQKSLPEFAALYNLTPNKPKVRFYEGIEGLVTIFSDVLNVKKDYCHIVSTEFMSDEIRKKAEEVIKGKVKLRLHSRVILDKNPWNLAHAQNDKKENRESRIIPEKYKICTSTRIYGNRVALMNYKELTGIIIEDNQIAKMMQMMFDVLWDVSEPFNKAKK